jgi:hypothetical protein
MRTGSLNTTRKATTVSKPGSRTKLAGSTPVKNDNDTHGGTHENGNGFEKGLLAAEETTHPEIEPMGAENHHPESDREHEHLGNGSLEVSYTEEPSDFVDESLVHDCETALASVDQSHVEEPEDSVRSESGGPASDVQVEADAASEPPHEDSVDIVKESKQKWAKDDIADVVGLLESTSFTSKHILQGSDGSVINDSHASGSEKEKERQRIGEIPDEE